MEPSATRLTVDGLTVRYFGRHVDALHEVSLSVGAGEVVGVAGRNGAGKSTLALAAAGFIPRIIRAKLEGAVRVDGDSVVTALGDTKARHHRVGIVFPSPSNQLSATKASVREELAFGLENLGIPREEMDGRVERVLAELGINHLADRFPFALSGGEQQRVAIASVMVMGADALVLDEPTAQLDPEGTSAVALLLAEEAARGTAVLVAEHDPAVLARTGRCLVLEEGRAAFLGVPGTALGTAVLGPLGMWPPTLVRLAEALGVPREAAFDEAAIVRALAAGAGRAPVSIPSPTVQAHVAWSPVRDQPPVAVAVQGLVHRYAGGVEALRGVDLRVQPGETLAIVGQNGSGKTTLVKHLNGLLRPTEGEVLVGPARTTESRVDRLAATVGFVFQDPDDQLFNRTVERELAFGPKNLGLSPETTTRLVEQALEAIGLGAERATNPYDLDVSRRKLVALGSVLAMDPAVLVLDEPTTGQDGPGVARVGAVVDGFAATGRTVIAITHDMEFAARHFRRIVVMRRGEVVADGPPDDVFSPANHALLDSTGLLAPPTARLAARLGLAGAPLTVEELLAALP